MDVTIKISQERYEQLLDIETRVNVAVEHMIKGRYCHTEDILRILGTEAAIKRADEIREEEKRRDEEYARKKSEEAEGKE